jgi:hypothetical protein
MEIGYMFNFIPADLLSGELNVLLISIFYSMIIIFMIRQLLLLSWHRMDEAEQKLMLLAKKKYRILKKEAVFMKTSMELIDLNIHLLQHRVCFLMNTMQTDRRRMIKTTKRYFRLKKLWEKWC